MGLRCRPPGADRTVPAYRVPTARCQRTVPTRLGVNYIPSRDAMGPNSDSGPQSGGHHGDDGDDRVVQPGHAPSRYF